MPWHTLTNYSTDFFAGDCDEGDISRVNILKVDNELFNIYIRVYYKMYWVEEYPKINKKWQTDILEECKVRFNYLFDWKEGFPYVKETIVLSNKECFLLEHLIENYWGLTGMTSWQFLDDCLDNPLETQRYKKYLTKHSKIPLPK